MLGTTREHQVLLLPVIGVLSKAQWLIVRIHKTHSSSVQSCRMAESEGGVGKVCGTRKAFAEIGAYLSVLMRKAIVLK